MNQKKQIKNQDIKKINIYKIILIGGTEGGKTSFLLRYFGEGFQEFSLPTIAIDYKMKEMQLEEGNTIKLQIWDTAGLERLNAVIRNYLTGLMV